MRPRQGVCPWPAQPECAAPHLRSRHGSTGWLSGMGWKQGSCEAEAAAPPPMPPPPPRTMRCVMPMMASSASEMPTGYTS
mgnify:CR=1 FL=1